EAFVAKYASNGSLVWVKRAGGQPNALVQGFGVVVDALGNSIVTGGFNGNVTFAPGENNPITFIGKGGFIAEYDPNGTLVWAKEMAAGVFVSGDSITLDAFGNSYVIGLF